jgi:hypothetical protein
LPLVAINIAASLSGIYLVQGHIEQALRYGNSALTVAQAICQPEELALTAIDIASIHLMRRDPFEMQPLLRIARSQVSTENVYLSTLISLFEAEAYLIEGHYRFALEAAEEGANAMEGLHLYRYLGSALRIKADADNALGNHAEAGRAICESLEVLESSGHAFALARAYYSAARICDEPAYSARANELTGAA